MIINGPTCRNNLLNPSEEVQLFKSHLPHQWQAPEFIAIDPCTQHQLSTPIAGLKFFVDDPEKFIPLHISQRYSPIFDYLVQVTQTKQAVLNSPLTIIWLSRKANTGSIRVAAGHTTLIANYLLAEKEEDKEKMLARTLMVAAHEQFHELTSLIRQSPHPLPTWINESLAQLCTKSIAL